MAYKKYVKRGGKIFGPYYYDSYRDANGKIKKRYLGTKDPASLHKKKNGRGVGPTHKTTSFFLLLLFFGVILSFTFSVSSDPHSITVWATKELSGREQLLQRFEGLEVLEYRSGLIRGPESIDGARRNKNDRIEFDLDRSDRLRLYFDVLKSDTFVSESEELLEYGVVEGSFSEVRSKVRDARRNNARGGSSRSTSSPGRSGSAPGQQETPPGQQETPPGQQETPPGQQETPPGQQETPPGQQNNVSRGNSPITGQVTGLITGFATRDNRGKGSPPLKDITKKAKKLSEGGRDYAVEESKRRLKHFSIQVTEATEKKYKWGYDVELTDMNFLARIDIESTKKISLWGSSGLRLENYILSFIDLVDEGYTVSIIHSRSGKRAEVYVQRDFSDTEHKIGDIITLDPTLVLIEIVSADHLYSNYSFIEDIYEEVRQRDGVWSSVIPDGHIVRVGFEKNLTSYNDITVYARGVNETNASIDVFVENGTEAIVSFDTITEAAEYKVYLSGLNGSEDIFDLRINGAIEFDLIIDPIIGGGSIDFVSPTPSNESILNTSYVETNVSLDNVTLDTLIFNWNGTNTTFFDDSIVLFLNFDNVSTLGENDTYVVDASSYRNNGTLVGGSSIDTSNCKYGNCVLFDSADEKLVIPDHSSLDINLSGYTISGWFYDDSSGSNWDPLISNVDSLSSGWQILWTGNAMRFNYHYPSTHAEVTCDSWTGFTTDTWHHFTLVFSDSDTLTCYYDGQNVTPVTISTGSVLDSTNDYALGSNDGLTIYYGGDLEGALDDVFIANRTFSSREVTLLYHSSLHKYDLDSWYFFLNQTKTLPEYLVNGTYTYYFWANDTSGNSNVTETRTVILNATVPDITSPNATFGTNVADGYHSINSSLTFDLACSDDRIIDTLELWTNTTGAWEANQTNTSVVNATFWNSTIANISSGTYIWGVYCNDTYGNEDWSDTNRTFIINSAPTVDWVIIETPAYDTVSPVGLTGFSDDAESNWTVYFEWYVNNVNVENDSVAESLQNESVSSTLDYSLSVGDTLNLSVFIGDGTKNSSVSGNSKNVVWGEEILIVDLDNSQAITGMDCDSTFCYVGFFWGTVAKVYILNGTIVYGGSASVDLSANHLYGMNCDSTFCWTATSGGDMIKFYTANGSEIFELEMYGAGAAYDMSCDSTFCWTAYSGGYLTKTYKSNGSTVWGDSGEVQPYTATSYDISCDSTFCYTTGASGYVVKTYKSNGSAVWGDSGEVQPYAFSMSDIECDDTFCYLANGNGNNGYFQKIYKGNGTVVIGGTSKSVGSISGFDCSDDVYCRTNANYGWGGVFQEIYKENGSRNSQTQVVTYDVLASTGRETRCDEIHCIGGHNNGYLSKVMLSSVITVQASPQVTSLDTPVNASWESTDIVFGFIPEYSGTISSCDLYGNWNGGWHLNATLTGISNATQNTFSAINLSEGTYVWNVKCSASVPGTFASTNNTVFVDSTAPVVASLSGMPSNNSVGGENEVFNWTVTDNFDSNMTCYPTYTGSVENATTAVYVANGSSASVAVTLPGGQHDLSVTCYDNANNSHSFSPLSYLVAVINMTEPVNGTWARVGTNTTFNVTEISGLDFLDIANISIQNSSSTELYNLALTGDPSHTGNYDWTGLSPQWITGLVTAYNISLGSSVNVTQSVSLLLLRAIGNTSSPTLDSACVNETYVSNETYVFIELISDLDTLSLLENVTLVSPSNISYRLSPLSSSVNGPNYASLHNYSFFVNETGTYSLLANVTDYENQSAAWNYTFYSSLGWNMYRINSSTISNMTRLDRCSSEALSSGTDLVLRVVNNSLFDLNVTVEDTLHSLAVAFSNISLTGNVSEAVGYRELSSEIDAPEGERRVAVFEFNSSLNFSSYTLVYNYTPIEHTLNNESSLVLYKCESISNCSLSELSTTLDIDGNTVSYSGDSLSFFVVTEAGTSVEIDTQTITTGGGGSTTIVYKSLDILTPGRIQLGLKDQLVVPILITNPEESSLEEISLHAVSNTQDIDPVFETDSIEELESKESTSILLFLESHSLPGDYEVTITAAVTNPLFNETDILYVTLVDGIGSEALIERIVLAQDLFREHPQCLELNDQLLEAERLVEENKTDEARELVQQSIVRCKDLVTGPEFPFSYRSVEEWKLPVLISLILIIGVLFVVLFLRRSGFGTSSRLKKSASRGRKKFTSVKRKRSGSRNPFTQ